MILIADTHAGKEGDLDDFFKMLDKLSESSEPIIFLGDIFDLWIGFGRYEGNEHKRFLEWCTDQKARRTVGFVEGNHEFFITDERANCFSWITDTQHVEGDLLFAHGDLINTDDINYLKFRKRTRSRFIKSIVRYLPFGPSICHFVKRRSKRTNKAFRSAFPEEAIHAYTSDQGKQGVRQLFLGHFHGDHKTITANGCTAHLIPGWFVNGYIARYSTDAESVEIFHWTEV